MNIGHIVFEVCVIFEFFGAQYCHGANYGISRGQPRDLFWQGEIRGPGVVLPLIVKTLLKYFCREGHFVELWEKQHSLLR